MLSLLRRCFVAVPLLMCSLVVPSVQAQEFYGFSEVLMGLESANKNTDIKPEKFEADVNGGIIRLKMPDTGGKTFGLYEFKWEFLDSIKKMELGKTYRYRMTGRRIEGASEKNSCNFHGQSTQTSGVLAGRAGIKRTGPDIIYRAADPSVSDCVAYPPGKNNTAEGTLRIGQVAGTPAKGTTYFGMMFHFASWPYSDTSKSCDYAVSYVFKANHVAEETKKIHCPNLYGVGFNVGIMEYGSLTDAKSEFLKNFADDALAHMKESSCIPKSEIEYLEDLTARMLKVERTKTFAAEISAFRQKLTLIINENCECKCDTAGGPAPGQGASQPRPSPDPEPLPEPVIKRLR